MDPVADLMLAARDDIPLALLVRYEGVLTADVATEPDPSLRLLLRRLVRRPRTRVHLLTAAAADEAALWFDGLGLDVHAGDGSPPGVTALLADVIGGAPDARLVVIGASLVDEELFRLVRAPHVTARVGSGATAAEARLEDVDTVRGLLGALC